MPTALSFCSTNKRRTRPKHHKIKRKEKKNEGPSINLDLIRPKEIWRKLFDALLVSPPCALVPFRFWLHPAPREVRNSIWVWSALIAEDAAGIWQAFPVRRFLCHHVRSDQPYEPIVQREREREEWGERTRGIVISAGFTYHLKRNNYSPERIDGLSIHGMYTDRSAMSTLPYIVHDEIGDHQEGIPSVARWTDSTYNNNKNGRGYRFDLNCQLNMSGPWGESMCPIWLTSDIHAGMQVRPSATTDPWPIVARKVIPAVHRSIPWTLISTILYYPVMLSHCSPAPVKKIRRYESNKPIKSKWWWRFTMKVYAWLIDFAHFPGNLPYGYNARVNAKSDSTYRDHTVHVMWNVYIEKMCPKW